MNRFSLLACLVLAGCPKASAPSAAETKNEATTLPMAAERADEFADLKALQAAMSSTVPNTADRLELQGLLVGATTIEEFSQVHPVGTWSWIDDGTNSADRTASLNQAGTFGDRPLLVAHYNFCDGVLESIDLTLEREEDTAWIRERLAEKFGKPDVADNTHIWRDATALLVSHNSSVSLSDRALSKKRTKSVEDKARGNL